MPWNKPGDEKDPWSGGGSGGGGNDGPPDLDEVVKKLQDRFGGLFGSARGGDGGGSSPGSGGGVPWLVIGVIGVILVLVWGFSGVYTIKPAERGVVLRFGAYSEITSPGLNWHIPYPIEEVRKINVDQLSSFRHSAQMLTADENIVDMELTVQYRIQDAADYWFQDNNPEKAIEDATATVMRETIGKSELDFILTSGRGSISTAIQQGIQELMKVYRTGLVVTSVNTQPAKPPEAVKGAFDDAIKAREDKERLENQAEAYANEVVPIARGAAARQVEDAKAYKAKVIAEAEGDTARFVSVLTEYEKAPSVTRERLYLETIEEVMAKSNKVVIDAENSNNLMYLPLDKMMQTPKQSPSQQVIRMVPDQAGGSDSGNAGRDLNRSRRTR